MHESDRHFPLWTVITVVTLVLMAVVNFSTKRSSKETAETISALVQRRGLIGEIVDKVGRPDDITPVSGKSSDSCYWWGGYGVLVSNTDEVKGICRYERR
jgi:hypothetical protein